MKKSIYIIPFCTLVLIFLASFSKSISNGPCDSPIVGGHTGAPGETSCTGCHGGQPNTGPGSLVMTLSDTTFYYSPGERFDASVTVRQTGRDKFGFVALALKDINNTTVGAFTIDDVVRTRTFNDGPRKYVSHTPCGADAVPPDSLSWTFHWQAPESNVGEITLYLAGLASNHSHSLAGDDTYTLTVKLLPDTIVSGVQDIPRQNKLLVWPNPAVDVIQFAWQDADKDHLVHNVEIWSLDGKLIKRTQSAQNKLSIKELQIGLYILRLIDSYGVMIRQATFIKA